MKRRSKIQRELYRHYLRRTIVVFVLAVLGVGLYFGLQSGSWNRLKGNISSVSNTAMGATNTNTAVESVFNPKEAEFQEFLEKSKPQRLILRSTELIDDDSDELLDRLERQDQKIRISDRLLKLKDDIRASNFGTLSKLKALRTRELINFDHGLTTESGIAELHDFAYRSTGTGIEEIESQSQLGKLYARLIQTLVFGDTSSLTAMEPVIREFKSVSQDHVKDADIAREIFGLLERIHVRVPETISRGFISEFGRVYKTSPSSEIRRLAETADEVILESEFDFVDVFGALSVDKTEALDELSKQLRVAFERPNISAQGYKRLVDQIRILGTFGRYDVALECTELLQRRIANRESLLPVVQAAQELRKRVSNRRLEI